MEHNLIIISLHDAAAKCSCGRWSLSFTGKLKAAEVRKEHREHLENIGGVKPNPKGESRPPWFKPPKYPPGVIVCPICGKPETEGIYVEECKCWDTKQKRKGGEKVERTQMDRVSTVPRLFNR
jgi:hypothetical protein